MLVKQFSITRFENSNFKNQPDLLAVEEPLEIRVAYGQLEQRYETKLAVTMRTPGNDFELAVGFLFTEGIVTNKNQIVTVRHCQKVKPQEIGNVVVVELHPSVEFNPEKFSRNFYTTSSCGVCGKSSIDSVFQHCETIKQSQKINLSIQTIINLPNSLTQNQLAFNHTGGIHATALFNITGKLIDIKEDVGRHNAFDKIVGNQLLSNNLNINNNMALVSGRASFELIQKAVMAKINVFVSIGAPSSLAANLASKANLTLIGFLKPTKFNIYHQSNEVNIF